MNLSPQFGGEVSKEQQEVFEKLEHYNNGKFLNFEPIDLKFTFTKVTKIIG